MSVKKLFLFVALCLPFLGAPSAKAQTTPPSPSIRGFVVGGQYTLFVPGYRPKGGAGADPLGQGSAWWFGYRPDIPQTPIGLEAPISYGSNGVLDGGFPNLDDWPIPYQHSAYTGVAPSSQLPPFDFFNQSTLYHNNTGT